MPYYKCTLANGESRRGPKLFYKLGLNVHPNPDKSGAVCSSGIHLGKTIKAARDNCPGAVELYEAEAGVILGEDSEKVRCAYIWLAAKLDLQAIIKEEQERKAKEQAEAERIRKRDAVLNGIKYPPICGMEWLEKHATDVSWDDWNKQGIEIITPRHTMNLKAAIIQNQNRKVLKEAIAGAMISDRRHP